MGPASATREALAAATALEAGRRGAIDLRLRPGDEGWQAVDADAVGRHRLGRRRLRLELRTMFARLMLLPGLIRLQLARMVT